MAARLRGPRSVRARTTALATALVALALAVGAVVLVTTLDRSLTSAGDDLALSRVADLAEQARAGRLPRVVTNVGDDSVAQVVSTDGSVLAASSNIEGRGPISAFRPPSESPVVRTMKDVPDDNETEDYRIWVQRVPTDDGDVTIYLGPSLEATQEVIGRLTGSLLVGLPLLVAGLGGLMWLVVGRALRPVEAIRSEVAVISHEDLGRRVPVPSTNDEVSRLATTMNEMLARLEEASARQRDFVANASHDLQSPLTALRTQLEVALAHPEVVDWGTTAQALHEEGDRMERLVRDLLFLAREDGADAAPPPALVDLDDVVLEEAARVRASSPVPVRTTGVTAAPVRGSHDALARLVRNLLDNACAHAASAVDVTLANGPGSTTLTVHDDGPGIPAAHRGRVFDRFYRVDETRDRSRDGTGLGLAIVRSVAERHGGTVELADGGPGATFVVRLPSA